MGCGSSKEQAPTKPDEVVPAEKSADQLAEDKLEAENELDTKKKPDAGKQPDAEKKPDAEKTDKKPDAEKYPEEKPIEKSTEEAAETDAAPVEKAAETVAEAPAVELASDERAPAVEAAPESAAESESQPATEAEAEPATEVESQPATEPASEPAPEPATEAEYQPTTEAKAEAEPAVGESPMHTAAKSLDALGPALMDLTEPEQEIKLRAAADALCALLPGRKQLEALRDHNTSDKSAHTFFTHLACSLAISKAAMRDLAEPFHLSMTFAVYGEINRACTKLESLASEVVGVHANGEDFVRNKVAQLDWVFEANTACSWDIVVCDDGCDNKWTLPNGEKGVGSGKLIEAIVAGDLPGRPVRVVYLQTAINEKAPCTITAKVESTRDSQKGGAVHYAMLSACESGVAEGKRHVVGYTDADLSTHLGQSGLLLDAIASGKDGAVGSRRHPKSVMIKSGTRNVRGIVNVFLWKQLMPEITYLTDTQTGFKAFEASCCKEILVGVTEPKLCFDIELLLKTQSRGGKVQAMVNVPICWQDSEAESTTGSASGYVKLLQTYATIYRTYLEKDEWRESFATWLDELTIERWEKLLANCPEGIVSKNAGDFTPEYRDITVEMLSEACK